MIANIETCDKDEQKISEDNFKTPMWCINQLANHNKLKHEYQLDKEEGHYKTKRFTMSLHIGGEVWVGSGSTKKEAKRNAAEVALKGTALPPLPENRSKKVSVVNQNALTATVKLNGMAMVLGKKVVYTVIAKKYIPSNNTHWNAQQQQLVGSRYISQDVRQQINSNSMNNMHPLQHSWHLGSHDNMIKNPRHSMHFKYYEGPCRFTVCATVGDDKFYGEGPTQQAARHDAARHAITFLQGQPIVPKPITVQNNSETEFRKSYVSILYEESLPRDMNVVFKLADESGPPHLKYYTLEVTVGFYTDGVLNKERPFYQAVDSGSSKKAAKQNVAARVLEKMKDLPPRVKGKKRRDNQTIIIPQTVGTLPPNLHPVSRLLQIAQAQKLEEPKYLLLEQEEGKTTPETKFAFECILKSKSVTGYGRNKKVAKRNAAESMLTTIGYLPSLSHAVPNLNMVPQKTSLKQKSEENPENNAFTKHLQVQFIDNQMVNVRPHEYIVPVTFS